MSERVIPEDLREEYKIACSYQNSGVVLCKQLIERIADLTAENSRLREAAEYLINRGANNRSISGSGDCGDHCDNSFPVVQSASSTGDETMSESSQPSKGGRPPTAPGMAIRQLAEQYGVSEKVIRNMRVKRFLACTESARMLLIGIAKRKQEEKARR